ncbi:hypothetical protein EST38_g11499 [Candolleomyces aberdarensis]|uniref:Uncharacterized protein n=1 Tax=Candolleomyces aberdarensis TaxID=2316362 RepID=A0A4Q2D5D9_9AGAR|nr:hypothetical protein EST38_g11499 [Candolleomyces aberdarensis]
MDDLLKGLLQHCLEHASCAEQVADAMKKRPGEIAQFEKVEPPKFN